jgi:hypothetical protein
MPGPETTFCWYYKVVGTIDVKTAHPQRVDVATGKTGSVEDDRLEADMRSASSGVDATDRHEVLRGLSVEIIQIFVRYRMSFSTALVPQLQLWHFHWLVSVQSVGDLHLRVT